MREPQASRTPSASEPNAGNTIRPSGSRSQSISKYLAYGDARPRSSSPATTCSALGRPRRRRSGRYRRPGRGRGPSPQKTGSPAVGAPELCGDGRRIGHVVAVAGPLGRGQDRRQIDVRHPEFIEVVEDALRIVECERAAPPRICRRYVDSTVEGHGSGGLAQHEQRAGLQRNLLACSHHQTRWRRSGGRCPGPRSTPWRSHRLG